MARKLLLDENELRRLYVDELRTLQEIADKLGTTRRSIANWLIRLGVPRRTYATRYFPAHKKAMVQYFKDWGNQSPYIIGYIYADGSIDVLNSQSKGVNLQCCLKDREIIDGIAAELGLSDQVKISYTKPSLIFGKYAYGPRGRCRLRFYNNELVDLLGSYGIFPRKTWINYPMPDVPVGAMPHFLRGVFDGDGWVSYRKGATSTQDRISFGFLGPEQFVTQIRDFLVSNIGLPWTKVQARPGHFAVFWQTAVAAEKLYAFLYQGDSFIHLHRKRESLRRMGESKKGQRAGMGRFAKGHPFFPRRVDVQAH